MRILILFLFVSLAFGQPPTGAFEIELWPGEGRPRFQATATDLVIREIPSVSARIVGRLRVSKGAEVAFDETRYRTDEPGELQVLSSANISGRVLGVVGSVTREAYYKGAFPRGAFAFEAGDGVEYLQDRAEGTCFVRIGDQVVDADPCPAQDERRFRVITQPKTERWIRVIVNGAPVGWLIVGDETVKLSGRSF